MKRNETKLRARKRSLSNLRIMLQVPQHENVANRFSVITVLQTYIDILESNMRTDGRYIYENRSDPSILLHNVVKL